MFHVQDFDAAGSVPSESPDSALLQADFAVPCTTDDAAEADAGLAQLPVSKILLIGGIAIAAWVPIGALLYIWLR
jgi:hypothetical protein